MDLDYPSTRPRILLSYNMDIWNRREEDEFPAMVQHTMRRVNKQGLKCAAIPRYVNFAQQSVFCDLLKDIQTLLCDQGYFLQQCASFNDIFNLKILLLDCAEDVLNCREETSGDNPAMVAAKMRHKEALSLILSNFHHHHGGKVLNTWNFVHSRNSIG